MDPQVPAQLRMECGRDQMSLAGQDDSVLVPRDRRASAPRPEDRRRTDEDAVERGVESGDLEVGLERLALAAERVAIHGHVHEPKEPSLRLLRLAPRVFREEDAPGARAHDGHSLFTRAAHDLVEEPELHEQLRNGRAFPAGNSEAIDARKIHWPADRDRLALLAVILHRPADGVDVFAHVALDADDANPHSTDLRRRPIKTISTRIPDRRGGHRFSCSLVRGPDGSGTAPEGSPRTHRNRGAQGAGWQRC